jgi:hypothetical protein
LFLNLGQQSLVPHQRPWMLAWHWGAGIADQKLGASVWSFCLENSIFLRGQIGKWNREIDGRLERRNLRWATCWDIYMVDLDFLARQWKISLGSIVTAEKVAVEKAWTILKDGAWRWKFLRTLDDMFWLNKIHPRDDPTAICDYPQTKQSLAGRLHREIDSIKQLRSILRN